MALIRPARSEDLPGLVAIVNHFIRETHVSFDLEPHTPASRAEWFAGFAEHGPHRLLVAEDAAGLAGYASSTSFRGKIGYARTVETSIYLRPGAEGRGLGRQLYGALFGALEGEALHQAIAGIALPNPASVALHARLGFHSVGVMREVGFKFSRYWDVEFFAKRLADA